MFKVFQPTSISYLMDTQSDTQIKNIEVSRLLFPGHCSTSTNKTWDFSFAHLDPKLHETVYQQSGRQNLPPPTFANDSSNIFIGKGHQKTHLFLGRNSQAITTLCPSQLKTLNLKKIIAHNICQKKLKHQHSQSSWYHSSLSFPTFGRAWSKSRVPDLGSICNNHAWGDLPFNHADALAELPGAWMALAICSTVGPLMSHLLFPWESTSWPRLLGREMFFYLEGRLCHSWGMDSSSLCTGTCPELVSIRNLGMQKRNMSSKNKCLQGLYTMMDIKIETHLPCF